MLEKKTILRSVEHMKEANTIHVCWLNQITEDGNVIHQEPHRKAYCQEQLQEFLAEVEGAEEHATLAGWK